MPRYTDIDALLSELPDDLPYKASVKRVLIQAPTADVVPKSEYDAVVSAVDNSTKLFLKLHDDYQEAKRELEELKKDRYQVLPDGRVELIPRSDVKALKEEVDKWMGRFRELHEVAELKQQRIAELEAEVAREIFEEIKKIFVHRLLHSRDAIDDISGDLDELKKKYVPKDCRDCRYFVGCETACGGRPCDEFEAKKEV